MNRFIVLFALLPVVILATADIKNRVRCDRWQLTPQFSKNAQGIHGGDCCLIRRLIFFGNRVDPTHQNMRELEADEWLITWPQDATSRIVRDAEVAVPIWAGTVKRYHPSQYITTIPQIPTELTRGNRGLIIDIDLSFDWLSLLQIPLGKLGIAPRQSGCITARLNVSSMSIKMVITPSVSIRLEKQDQIVLNASSERIWLKRQHIFKRILSQIVWTTSMVSTIAKQSINMFVSDESYVSRLFIEKIFSVLHFLDQAKADSIQIYPVHMSNLSMFVFVCLFKSFRVS